MEGEDCDLAITNAIQIIQTHIESCSIHARAEGDAGKKEVATALTKSKEAVDCAKTAKEIKTAASQFEKASNMCTSERTISKLKNGIAKASPVLLTILTDTDLKKSVYQGCRTTSNHADAAALVISCLNVVLTVRSDRATIPDGFVPQAFCDIRDDQLRSVIMVGGWSIREARIIFFKQYRNDPDRKKKLYTLIGAITMAFSMNVVTPAEDGDCDDGDMTITDVSDQIPLFLKMYNEGGLTYPSVAVRAWVHSFFQYIDECFDRMSKSSRQLPDMKHDYEQRLMDICRNAVTMDEQCQITLDIINDTSKVIVSKLTNARNGMLLRNYLGNQNILSSEKVHIRQQLAAYSIVGSKVKDRQMDNEFDDDDLRYFQPFNEAEDYFLSEYTTSCGEDNDHIIYSNVGI